MRKALEQMPLVVVGGGGGTHAAHALRNAPVRVTVIDRTNHSIFHPLLYQVASAGLSSDEIAVPIRFLLRRQRNSEVMMAEVTGAHFDTVDCIRSVSTPSDWPACEAEIRH